MTYAIAKYFLILPLILATFSSKGQQSPDNTIGNCDLLLSDEYVSSGQEYFADLNKNNKATFYATFYGGSQYRIVACTNIKKHKLVLNIYDTEKNLLFSNKNYDYTPYWNLAFTSTVDCIIELKIKAKKHIKKPVKLLIGFKEKSNYLN